MKLATRIALAFVLVALATVLGVAGWAWSEGRAADGSLSLRFRIPPGEALSDTAQRLAQGRLVRNPWVFREFVRLQQGDGSFPSGTFEVPGGMTVWQAAQYFRKAQPLQVKVTIPEGWTGTKIARLLEGKDVVSAQEFLEVVHHPATLGDLGRGLETLDGRLFPDTYRFPVESKATEVARTLVQTFRDRTAQWGVGRPTDEFQNRVTLASIVEREYRVDAEAPVIASVFLNRLRLGIPLGSCATIEYILTEIEGRPHPKRIFFVHTEIPSPFNTYLNKGLPPAPISNPGLTSLRAAFEPADSTYLYFVVADASKGSHTFSSNYSQHERAREAYLSTFVTKG